MIIQAKELTVVKQDLPAPVADVALRLIPVDRTAASMAIFAVLALVCYILLRLLHS